MRSAHRMLSLLVVGATAIVACAHPIPTPEARATPDTSADSAPPMLIPVALVVQNNHSGDVVISVIHGGMTNRLGIVSVGATQTFRIPGGWVVPAIGIEVVARPIGGSSSSTYRTGIVSVRPGQSVDISLESNLPRSTYSVY